MEPVRRFVAPRLISSAFFLSLGLVLLFLLARCVCVWIIRTVLEEKENTEQEGTESTARCELQYHAAQNRESEKLMHHVIYI